MVERYRNSSIFLTALAVRGEAAVLLAPLEGQGEFGEELRDGSAAEYDTAREDYDDDLHFGAGVY